MGEVGSVDGIENQIPHQIESEVCSEWIARDSSGRESVRISICRSLDCVEQR